MQQSNPNEYLNLFGYGFNNLGKYVEAIAFLC